MCESFVKFRGPFTNTDDLLERKIDWDFRRVSINDLFMIAVSARFLPGFPSFERSIVLHLQ
jgi:hypothetical protein